MSNDLYLIVMALAKMIVGFSPAIVGWLVVCALINWASREPA